MFVGGADMRLALIAVKKSCARRSKSLGKKPTGRYLQMLSRDEMRSLNNLPLSNQAAQLFKEARRDLGGGGRDKLRACGRGGQTT